MVWVGSAAVRSGRNATGSPARAGVENALRLQRLLWRDGAALAAVRSFGLTDATIRRFGLGLREPYASRVSGDVTERALTYPVALPDGSGVTRWACMNLEGVTAHPLHPRTWGAGIARSYFSRAPVRGMTVLLVPGPVDVWLLAQALGDAFGDIVVMSASHEGEPPAEWMRPTFWSPAERVVLGVPDDDRGDAIARMVATGFDGALARTAPPSGGSWSGFVAMGASAREVAGLVRDAGAWCPPPPASPPPGLAAVAGDFGAEPVSVEGAFVGGRMYWPVTLERRGFEDAGDGVQLVQRYVVQVLRSDGRLLDVATLPAPAGTPRSARVLALSDGLRIASAPAPGRFGTWRWPSISAFLEARSAGREPGHRPLVRIRADVEERLRAAVWLPRPDDYALLSLFVLATFVHRVFDALPVILLNGPRASGKSELAQSVASMSANAVLAGRITAAGLVRLLAESRGLVVLDDLERIGSGSGVDDLSQLLKVSYKQATARRVTPGRDGRAEVLDFFSPKLVSNVTGADEVLLSRMLCVRTGPIPASVSMPARPDDDASDLRDELHVWAMCRAADVAAIYRPLADMARSREAEIAAPLIALASMCDADGGDVGKRLGRALAGSPAPVTERLEVVLRRVLANLADPSPPAELAMPQIQLELALAGVRQQPSAESLGRLLLTVGARSADGAVSRRRLHGELVRIYGLRDRPTGSVSDQARDPLAFCAAPCGGCRYREVCADTLPGLMARRELRGVPD